MTWTSILLLAGAAMTLAACVGFGGGRAATRDLRELGRVSIPKRLETQGAEEKATYAIFPFVRYANSLRFMGPNPAKPEILALAAWRDASRQTAREQALAHVKYFMERRPSGFSTVYEPVALKKQGEHETGEGIQYINASAVPAWIVVRESPAAKLTVAYMVWKQDSSLEKARELVDSVIASFERKSSLDEYLAIAADRPATERAARLKALEAALAKLGVPPPRLDGGTVEHNGVLYELFTDEQQGKVFLIHAALGELRPADPERRFGPDAPSERLPVVWMDGARTARNIDGPGWTTARMRARMRPGQAYMTHATLLDQLDMPGETLAYTLEIAAAMRKAHAAGKLVTQK